jgi:transcriptional regulator GlxA family with amidase domain
MKNIAILVPQGAASVGCIEGSYIGFSRANEVLAQMGKQPLFQMTLVGLSKDAVRYDRFISIEPDITIQDDYQADLIIMPAVNGEWNEVIRINQNFFPWINAQYKNGAEVASLCVGAFLLAATGLLDGRKAATHWIGHNEFRKMFPNVELVAEGIITDERGVYSSGGATSFWNLIIYLIDKFAGRDVAIACAKIYEIEMGRTTQSPFVIFQGQKDHEDDAIRDAQAFIENNYSKKITVEDLAAKCALTRRTFERRFKRATSNTVVEYLQRVKIEAAKRSLEVGRKHVSEVMYDVGYTDTKAFRTTFKKITGLSPIDYRNKYA